MNIILCFTTKCITVLIRCPLRFYTVGLYARAQPRFQSPFYGKKLDRSTLFGAVGYIITLYSSKSYVKSWGPSKFWGGRTPRHPSGCTHAYMRLQVFPSVPLAVLPLCLGDIEVGERPELYIVCGGPRSPAPHSTLTTDRHTADCRVYYVKM